MPDIFDEIQDDLRAEQAKRLFLRYGALVLLALVIVIAGVGGWQVWRWHQNKLDVAAAQAFLDASTAADKLQPSDDNPAPAATPAAFKEAAARFGSIAGTAPEGYRTLALLRQAGLLAEAGDTTGALAAWDALAGDTKADSLYRSMASLLWVQHALDIADPAMLRARLTTLTASGAPWRAEGEELFALLELRQGDKDAARKRLTALQEDAMAPEGLRDRAGRLLAEMGS